ncbi:MAG: HAD family hydrolase [Nitrososphaerota archaeon]|nr:HAD family hydrolase [Nitrososphaerota archaeon]
MVGATKEFFSELLNCVKLDENAKTVLQNLHGKYKLGIISNYPTSEEVHTVLKANEIDELFDIVVISCAVNRRKPSPEIFQITLKKLGVLAEETVFVGDRAYADISGAHAARIKAVYIKRRFDQDLEIFTPDHIIESLVELPSALNTLSHKY